MLPVLNPSICFSTTNGGFLLLLIFQYDRGKWLLAQSSVLSSPWVESTIGRHHIYLLNNDRPSLFYTARFGIFFILEISQLLCLRDIVNLLRFSRSWNGFNY